MIFHSFVPSHMHLLALSLLSDLPAVNCVSVGAIPADFQVRRSQGNPEMAKVPDAGISAMLPYT